MTEEEKALQYLNSLKWPETSLTKTDDDETIIRRNIKLINAADRILIDRLEAEDASLRVQDIISIKDWAFRHNQILKNWDEDNVDYRKLIPSVINIQIINN